jgi:hypothetical protein
MPILKKEAVKTSAAQKHQPKISTSWSQRDARNWKIRIETIFSTKVSASASQLFRNKQNQGSPEYALTSLMTAMIKYSKYKKTPLSEAFFDMENEFFDQNRIGPLTKFWGAQKTRDAIAYRMTLLQ